jgi:hypothetical protein
MIAAKKYKIIMLGAFLYCKIEKPPMISIKSPVSTYGSSSHGM